MTLSILISMTVVLAAVPCLLFVANLFAYRRLPLDGSRRVEGPERNEPISVLIPARNEEQSIGPCLQSVLANTGVEFEVVVLDDHSDDSTAQAVKDVSRRDSRVRLISAPPLPMGWCGKQHACHVLATLAKHPLLLFIDADVRLAPNALRRLAAFVPRCGADLVSGVPRQQLGTFSEALLLPLIHFLLLGFLPMFWMRRSRAAAFGAGCGQLFIGRAGAYRKSGGHAAIRDSLHDGLKLPRVFRQAGFKTDLFDATDLAVCRMYRSNGEVWGGLGKNAIEGLAAPGRIVLMTAWLIGGQVLPFVLFAYSALSGLPWAGPLLGVIGLVYAPRLLAAWRFQQPLASAFLHPLGILTLLGIQWAAFARYTLGRPSVWKGRAYSTASAAPPAEPDGSKSNQPKLAV